MDLTFSSLAVVFLAHSTFFKFRFFFVFFSSVFLLTRKIALRRVVGTELRRKSRTPCIYIIQNWWNTLMECALEQDLTIRFLYKIVLMCWTLRLHFPFCEFFYFFPNVFGCVFSQNGIEVKGL